jgi:hypothetical protein
MLQWRLIEGVKFSVINMWSGMEHPWWLIKLELVLCLRHRARSVKSEFNSLPLGLLRVSP